MIYCGFPTTIKNVFNVNNLSLYIGHKFFHLAKKYKYISNCKIKKKLHCLFLNDIFCELFNVSSSINQFFTSFNYFYEIILKRDSKIENKDEHIIL